MNVVLRTVLESFVYFFIILIAAEIISRIWDRIFVRFSRKLPTRLFSILLKNTRKPVYYFILIFGFYLVYQRILNLPQVKNSVGAKFIQGLLYSFNVLIISYLTYVVIQSFISWYLQDIAKKTKTRLDDEFLPLLGRLLRIVVFFIAIIIILSHFKVNITGFLATAGVASLAVAFAAQETIANLISGFTILVDKPFRIGDRIQLPSGEIGDVIEVGLRSTKILSFDHNVIVIPNSEVTKAKVVNYSYPNPRFKIRMTLGVAYGSDMEKVKRVIREILKAHPDVLDEPAPDIFFVEFGDSSLNLLIVYWISDYREKFRIMDEINMEIDKRFREEGIVIPFPQRDIHIIPPEE